MSKISYATAASITLPLCLAASAAAAPMKLECSSSPGGSPTIYMTVDAATGVVQMNIGTFQAQVTAEALIWQTPAANLPGGGYRPAAYYILNRATGDLNVSGSDFMSSAYCRAASPPLIP